MNDQTGKAALADAGHGEVVLVLTEADVIGRGKIRTCYQHPEDPDRCIKIDFKRHRRLSSSEKEALYYQKLAWLKPSYDYRSVIRFHGWIETSLGRGAVFDLVRDETTGAVSKTLRECLRSGEVTEHDARWQQALQRFRDDVLKHTIMLRDVGAHNLCVRRRCDGRFDYIAIDGIGHRNFIPLVDFVPWLARRSMIRSLERRHLGSIAALMRHHERTWTGSVAAR